MEYLLILTGVLICGIFLQKRYQIRLYRCRKERIFIPAAFLLIGVAWDSLAVYREHWAFSNTKLLGITIGVLPLEEFVFFLIVPYFILVVYKFLQKKLAG